MLYFRHSELVNTYHVSLKTVHNWIDASKRGKLDLELHEHNGRTYIANKPGNLPKLQRLSEEGKKYRNARFHKVIHPTEKFYETYSRRQILDIISNLSIHREIPRQYNYMDGGATNWDNWVTRLAEENNSNMHNNTVELIKSNLETLDTLLRGKTKVNVIDLGAGNALPVKDLAQHLIDRQILHRYIAIDISEPMLRIAEKNLKKWFGSKINYEGYVRDISFERFDDLVLDDMLHNTDGTTVNLVLLFGLTPLNFRSMDDVLKVVYGSMSQDDMLMYTCKPDTPAARRYFDFAHQSSSSGLSPNHRLIMDLLNIDSSLYEVEAGFSEQKRMRYIRVRLNTSLTIKFDFKHSERSVMLEKGDTILLLRVWHYTTLETIDEFEKIGFVLLQSSLTKDREGLMTISGINAKSDQAQPS